MKNNRTRKGAAASRPAAQDSRLSSDQSAPFIQRSSERHQDPDFGDPRFNDFHEITYSAPLNECTLAAGFYSPVSGTPAIDSVSIYNGKEFGSYNINHLTPEQAYRLGHCLMAAGAEAMAINARFAIAPSLLDSRPTAAESAPQPTQDTPPPGGGPDDPHCPHCGGTGFDSGFTMEEADNPMPCMFCGGTGRSDGTGEPAQSSAT